MENNIKVEKVDNEETIQNKSRTKLNFAIKHEKELLIENDNQREEANGYYEEFGLDGDLENVDEIQIKDEPIELSCDNEDEYDEVGEYNESNEDDHVGNYYGEEILADVDQIQNYYDEEISTEENTDDINKSESTSLTEEISVPIGFNNLSFTHWINRNFIEHSCHLCSKSFRNGYDWRRHIETEHMECISEAESNYHIDGTTGTCKECNQLVDRGYSQVLHTLEHFNMENIVCKICKYTSSGPSHIKKHIVEKHKEVVEKFKTLKYDGKLFKCPMCSFIYNRSCILDCHIEDEHPQEYNEKFTYNCHLCFHERFFEKDQYLLHLMEGHLLNSWENLDYRRLFEGKDYFSCTKCFMIFIKNDKRILLQHYLSHIVECHWKCKFCRKKFSLKKCTFRHICTKMIVHYISRFKKDKNFKVTSRRKLENWQEFEEYIAHVCSFCNETFNNTEMWQTHLRTIHNINALDSLKMKVVPEEVNKLLCAICHTMVVNTPAQLHAHRFQHLPYKPYKCTHCSQTLATYKVALNHVLNRCKNINSSNSSENEIKRKSGVRASIIIRCPFCNYRQFNAINDVVKHFKEEHNSFVDYFSKNPNDSMTCNVCAQQFILFDEDVCLSHLHNHLYEKAFKCMLCPNSYKTLKFCYKHLIVLHYATPVNEQKTLFREITEMSNTLLSSVSEEDVTRATKFKIARNNSKSTVFNEFIEFITYACPECNESMSTQKDWHGHIINRHDFFEESNLIIKDSDGNIKCPTCLMKLPTNISSQQKHKLTHMPHRSFICNLCYTRFNSLGVLYGHFRRHHFAAGSFKCPICSEVLKTAHDRTEHLKNTHPICEWPDNICLICYKLLKDKSSLARHMDIHVADRVKHTCNICGSKILDLKDFNNHLERHEKRGERIKMQNPNNDTFEEKSSKSSVSNKNEENEEKLKLDLKSNIRKVVDVEKKLLEKKCIKRQYSSDSPTSEKKLKSTS